MRGAHVVPQFNRTQLHLFSVVKKKNQLYRQFKLVYIYVCAYVCVRAYYFFFAMSLFFTRLLKIVNNFIRV